MEKVIDMGGVSISPIQKKLVNKVLNSDRVSYGKYTQEFERKWAEMHEVKYALFCNSGTSALQVAIHALKDKYNWKNGDEVIIPALTFVATMNVVIHNNLKPVFVDIEPDYYSIDPKEIKKKITKKTRAIIAVHLLGHPALMDEIMKIARKYKLKVIEDSCETVASTFKGQPVGSFGDVSCFSTYASHLVVTGVGGFSCTSNDDMAMRIKGLYNHGRDGVYHSIDDDDKNTLKLIEHRFRFIHSGYSYRATEMESALGLGHLERFENELEKRRRNADLLTNGLSGLNKYLITPKIHPKATHSFMLYPLVVKNNDRDDLIVYLEKNKIMTRYMMPLTSQPIVKKLFGNIEGRYPIAEFMNKHAFLLGVHQDLTEDDMNYVVGKINTYFVKKYG